MPTRQRAAAYAGSDTADSAIKLEAHERVETSIKTRGRSFDRSMAPPLSSRKHASVAAATLPVNQSFVGTPTVSNETSSSHHPDEDNQHRGTPTLVSASEPFSRSGAPSIDTRRIPHSVGEDNRSESTHDVHLMQIKIKPARNGGDRSTPSSQAGDVCFAQDSFIHNSFTDIGMKLKACNDTLGELQQLGVQHVAQLPELVMVGDQSAGKSSLMSGLAELNLPHSGGVCTRCPIHIRLSRSNDPHWSCSVSLQQDYDFKPNGEILKTHVTKANPFPPWVPKAHRVVKSFKTIYIKSEIEDVLRWAQIAVLNHNRNSDLYIPGEGAIAKETSLEEAVEETDAQFSPNIVALEIKGPNLPDLSFYDLPGVFLSPPQEKDEYLVRVVRNLSTHYIQRPQAIIMWALPMNHDPENSISLGIIREAKAQARTIGVMTKADKVQPDNITTWLSILRGEKHPIGQGFFITSRPPQQEGDLLDRATQWEEQFFTSNAENWPMEFQEFSDRCGVEVLKEFLSKKLGDAFSSSLPSIKHKVNERLRNIQQDLANLPELPHNVEHEVKKSLYNFYGTVKDAINSTEFQAEWAKLNKQFQSCIIAIKPTCKLMTPDEATSSLGGSQQPIDLGSDDENIASADTPSRKRPRPSDSTIRATPKRARHEGAITPVMKQEDNSRATPFSVWSTPAPEQNHQQQRGSPSPFIKYHHLGRQGLNFLTIRAEINRQKRAGMPHGLIPSPVYDELTLKSIRKWGEPLDCYIDRTMTIFRDVLLKALRESMATLSRRMIFAQSKQHLEEYIEKMGATQRGKLADLLEAETYRMYTTNDDAYRRYREQEEDTLKRGRAIHRLQNNGSKTFHATYQIRPMERMSEEERATERNNIARELPSLRGEDEYSNEIGVAAVVRGYYILSAIRFVESVTLSVNSRLFRDVADSSLNMYLDEKLGLVKADDHTFSRLMEEDDAIAIQRDQLKREMQKLRRAMESINDLELGGGNNGLGFDSLPGEAVEVDGVMEI